MLELPIFSSSFTSTRHRTTRLGLLAGLGLLGCMPAEPGPPDGFRSAGTPQVTSVSLGKETTCATLHDGRAKCWGRGDLGRLGTGLPTSLDKPEPGTLLPLALGSGAAAIVTNGAQSYARLQDGHVRAFGRNATGELGIGHLETVGDDETPADASVPTLVPLAGPAAQLTAGEGFACARLSDGRVQCWGRGDRGQLGRGTLTGVHPPGDVILSGPAEQIVAGAAHACARLGDGALQCWGRGDAGQLGYGHAEDVALPTSVGPVPLDGPVIDVVAGEAHTCALLDDGHLRCWGDNSRGQLGHGHTEGIGDDELPVVSVPLDGTVVSVATGRHHTCALLDDGALRCWGEGERGQLGLDHRMRVGDDELPTEVAIVDMGPDDVEAVFSGALADHTCALLGSGSLRCWGSDSRGQIGLGWVNPQDPVQGPPGDLPDVIIVEDQDL